MSEINTIIQLRNDTAENWATEAGQATPLKPGEVAVEVVNGKAKLKIGTSNDSTFGNSEYFGSDVKEAQVYQSTILTKNDEQDDITVIESLIPEGAEVQNGDIAIIKRYITGESGAVSHTSYVYDSDLGWAATDGNYSANNVFFKDDITVTVPIGTITQTMINNGNGSTKLSAKGNSLASVLSALTAQPKNPTTDTPSIGLTVSGGTKEVGETFTLPTATVKVSDIGSYSYGSNKSTSTGATGVKFVAGDVTISQGENNTKSNSSDMVKDSTLTLQATGDNTTYGEDAINFTFSATAKYTTDPETIPVNNIGTEMPTYRIGAGTYGTEDENNKVTVSITDAVATFTGYRSWFYGYIAPNATSSNLIDVNQLAGEDNEEYATGKFRSDVFTKTNGTFPSSLTTNKMQQIFFAAPAGKVTEIGVKNSKNDAPQTITKLSNVYIQGANGYEAIAYDVFYASNAGAEGGETTFTITKK